MKAAKAALTVPISYGDCWMISVTVVVAVAFNGKTLYEQQ